MALAIMALGAAACRPAVPAPDDIAALPPWTATPELEIAGPDTEGRLFLSPSQMFIADGETYTLHLKERRVRVFDSESGEGLRSLIGPDGLQVPRSLGAFGDTVWVVDDAPTRGFRFFARGSGVPRGRHAVTEGPPGSANYRPTLQGFWLLSAERMLSYDSHSSEAVVREQAERAAYLHQDVFGAILDTLAVLPVGRSTVGIVREVSGGGIYGSQPFSDDPLFGHHPLGERFAVLHRRISADQPPRVRLEVRTLAGAPIAITEFSHAPRPIERSWVDGVVLSWQQTLGMPFHEADARIRAQLYVPERLPFADELHVAADGRVWLREWNAEKVIRENGMRHRAPREASWVIIGADGLPEARLLLPAEVRWLWAEGDQLWGTHAREDGAGVIVRYRLTAAAAPSQ